MTEVQEIYKKDSNGIWQSLRDQKVKDSNNTWRTFGVGSGVKGNDGEWYVLSNPIPSDAVRVGGLIWDKQNIADYATFDMAQLLASDAGKRLIGSNELYRLQAAHKVWDDVLKGTWYADNSADLKNPNKSLFLPALGYRDTNSNILEYSTFGYYWTSTPYTYNNNNNGYYWKFERYYDYVLRDASRALGFSVRCIRDL